MIGIELRRGIVRDASRVTLPEQISHTSAVDSVNGLYSRLFILTVTVSDDPGKTYSIDCLVYRVWNHCDLPAAASYSAEIEGDTMKITAVENNKKHTTYKVKYRITYIQPDTTPRP
jgi:hypothetical protein